MAVTLLVVAPGIAPASAHWSVSTAALSAGLGGATTVKAGSRPTVSVVSDQVTVSWAASTLANGIAVSGYTVTRFSSSGVATSALAGCSGRVTALTCAETGVPNGSWTYSITPRLQQNWVGAQSIKSLVAVTDSGAPINNISLVATPNAHLSGSTVWVRTSVPGASIQLSNALVGVASTPASSTSALTGTAGGFSHTAGTVSTPTGGPYVSSAYSWTLNAAGSPTARITGRDASGRASITDIRIRPDNTAPTGGAITYPNGQQTTSSVTITLGAIADVGSGVRLGSPVLQYSQAGATGAVCGTFSEWIDFIAKPSSTLTVSVGSGCSRFRHQFKDNVGNVSNVQPTNNATVIYHPPANRVAAPSEDPSAETFDDEATVTHAPAAGDKPSGSPIASQTDAIACTSVPIDGIGGCDRMTRPVDDDMAAHDDVLPPATVQDRHSLGKPK